MSHRAAQPQVAHPQQAETARFCFVPACGGQAQGGRLFASISGISSSLKQLWIGQVFFRFGTRGLQELGTGGQTGSFPYSENLQSL